MMIRFCCATRGWESNHDMQRERIICFIYLKL
jgi:hypothetical protein